MPLVHVIILLVSIALAPFASVRFADQIYVERAVPFLSTVKLLAFSKKLTNKSAKAFLIWLAQFCDCYWCVSFVSALFVIIFMTWTPLRIVVILYGLSEITILMNQYLHKE